MALVGLNVKRLAHQTAAAEVREAPAVSVLAPEPVPVATPLPETLPSILQPHVEPGLSTLVEEREPTPELTIQPGSTVAYIVDGVTVYKDGDTITIGKNVQVPGGTKKMRSMSAPLIVEGNSGNVYIVVAAQAPSGPDADEPREPEESEPTGSDSDEVPHGSEQP